MIGLGLGLSLGAVGKAVGGPKLPLNLPVAPLLFAGTSRMAGWSGSAAKVPREASPSSPATFGWGEDNRLDLAAVETYIGGQNVTARVDTLFDQSGNGYDLIQPTHGARAQIRRSQIDGGALPLTCGPNITYPIPAGISVDRANHSIFLVLRPHLSRAYFTWVTLGANFEFGTNVPDTTIAGGGVRVRDGVSAVSKIAARAPKTSGVAIIGYSSGASDVKIYNNRNIETIAGGFTAGTLTGGKVENSGYSEIFTVVMFPRALTETEMASVGRQLEAIASIQIGQTKGVYMIGDSITAGQGSIAVYVAGLGMSATEPDQLFGALGSPSDVAIFNCGQPSIPMSGLNSANGRARILELMNGYPEITKRVARVHAGINDLRAGSTDTTVYNAIVAYCTWLRSQGVKVIASTINAQGIVAPYTEQAETYRLSINSQIRANWETFADDMVDYANITELADPNNTTYFNADKLHQTAQAYQLKSALVAPKIHAILA
ncbi:SGNH/GDSL hydrolase family protein [Agrobacterium tumefaciens]|uniref:SGNH/GDSL hydrolase family protein n=1 Tax=Agrobacterium tumefaciens TaxID=358 RepID=UPI001573139C|nr:SGNH/GDSL hydrolase family protein [Agrobacterium tumefaciens]NSX90155.1 SGNH/GDSL hydrolase family protein [Agrobacterium tumefaciens]